jgi:hypothetical protein
LFLSVVCGCLVKENTKIQNITLDTFPAALILILIGIGNLRMKNTIKTIFPAFLFAVLSGCASVPEINIRFQIRLDHSQNSSPYVQSAWISYTSHISDDMGKYYALNPDGDYTVPFYTELRARNSLVDFYLKVRKDYNVYDKYIEDMIKIRNAKFFTEYVFFSFNPGTWAEEVSFEEDAYRKWLNENMPEHVPLTLASVERIE